MAGLAFITRLRAQLPGVRILAMSWSDSLESAALDGGADGFVRKTFRPDRADRRHRRGRPADVKPAA